MTKIVEIGGSRLQNFLHFQRDPLGFMEGINHAGDIVSLRSSRRTPSYVLNDPEAIREVLIAKEQSFRKGRSSQILKATVGEGILTTEGEKHEQQRKEMLPAFHKSRIQEYSQAVIEQTLSQLQPWQSGGERWIHTDMMKLTLSVIIRTMFGANMGEEAEKIGEAVEETIQYTARRVYSPIPLPKFLPTKGNLRHNRSLSVLHETARMYMNRHQNGPSSHSLLSQLLQAKGVEEREIIDQMITMLIAGHETTANALSWTCYLLSQHPEVERKWREELNRVLGNRLPAYEDLARLSYSQQIWQESLRLYPPAWMILREAREEVEIQGNRFTPNSIFMICPYSLHRNSRFFERPLEFIPERFSPLAENSIPRYAFLPFGAGSRSCIGNQFATMEGLLILILIAQRFRLELVSDHHPIRPEPSVSLRMKDGLRMRVHTMS